MYFNSIYLLRFLVFGYPPNQIIKKTFPFRNDSLCSRFIVFSASSQLLNKTFSNLTGLKIKELEANNSWQIIDLSHNSIKFIDSPELLRKQIYLETLRLNFNSDFNGRGNEQILDHKILKSFECVKCGFTEIQSQHFAGLISLTELCLTANKINRISENAFKSNENLKLVDLSENQLKILPYSTFVGLRRFESLYLTMNPIELPQSKAFLKSESLKHLKMDDCNMPVLYPETLTELRHLETLNLNRNQIESLPVNSFKSNMKLKSLFIESNRMRFFSDVVLDVSPQIEELCIDNNTFIESSELSKFVKKYDERRLRTENCSDNVEYFIENLFADVSTDVPSELQSSTEKSSKFVKKFINEGVSNFFIGSYISLLLILQAAAFVLLSIYYIKITKFEKLDGEVNYANTILNDDEIYQVYKSNE